MTGTTDFSSVPMTNGSSVWVPTPHVEIWRPTGSTDSTTGPAPGHERVYPIPVTQLKP